MEALIDSKIEYTEHFITLAKPLFAEGFRMIYTSTKQQLKDKKYLFREFQNKLRNIPQWSTMMVDNEYERMVAVTRCDWMPDLIRAMFKTHIKALVTHGLPHNSQKPKLNITIPTASVFIHQCYIEIARNLFKKPFLLYDGMSKVEYANNQSEFDDLIRASILSTVRHHLPYKEVITSFNDDIHQDEENANDEAKYSIEKKGLKKKVIIEEGDDDEDDDDADDDDAYDDDADDNDADDDDDEDDDDADDDDEGDDDDADDDDADDDDEGDEEEGDGEEGDDEEGDDEEGDDDDYEKVLDKEDSSKVKDRGEFDSPADDQFDEVDATSEDNQYKIKVSKIEGGFDTNEDGIQGSRDVDKVTTSAMSEPDIEMGKIYNISLDEKLNDGLSLTSPPYTQEMIHPPSGNAKTDPISIQVENNSYVPGEATPNHQLAFEISPPLNQVMSHPYSEVTTTHIPHLPEQIPVGIPLQPVNLSEKIPVIPQSIEVKETDALMMNQDKDGLLKVNNVKVPKDDDMKVVMITEPRKFLKILPESIEKTKEKLMRTLHMHSLHN